MGISHIDKFSNEQNILAKYAKTLGHPARIAIIEYLINSSSCICGDIVEALPLSQSTISQHLKKLKDAGIIELKKNKTSSCYCLNIDACKDLLKTFNRLFENIENCYCNSNK